MPVNTRLCAYSVIKKPNNSICDPSKYPFTFVRDNDKPKDKSKVEPEPEPYHSFPLKPKETRKICEVLGCDYDCYNYSPLCQNHYKLNNESKKCDTIKCPYKRSKEGLRCEKCDDEMKVLEDRLDKIHDEAFEIVNSLNNDYNRNYSTEWYLY